MMKYRTIFLFTLALALRGTFAAVYTTLEYENQREANTLATVRGEIAAAKPGNYAAVSNAAMSAASASDLAAVASDVTTVVSDVAAVDKKLDASVSLMYGDDVIVEVTNYFGSVDQPKLSIKQKVSDGTNETVRTVWDEMTRWNAFLDQYSVFSSNTVAALEEKADRAFGYYDSHTGLVAPAGYTSFSSQGIIIANGMSYQQTVTSAGAVWVLTSDEPTVISGDLEGGHLTITDGEGNSVFEVVKGNKQTVPANPAGLTTTSSGGQTVLNLTYTIESDEHPLIEVCSDLRAADWVTEGESGFPATATWSGSSGEWKVSLVGVEQMNAMFVRGTYETGGETQIKSAYAQQMEKIVIGGVTYTVGTAEIDGKTVLTLTR